MMLAVLAAAGAITIGMATHFSQRIQQAHSAQREGEKAMAQRDWQTAIRALEHGLYVARDLPFQAALADELDGQLQRALAAAGRAAAGRELNQLANRIRLIYAADRFTPEELTKLEGTCREFWENRARIVERLRPDTAAPLEASVRDDLIELAIARADVLVRLAPADGQDKARRHALAVLDEAEALFGSGPRLDVERRRLCSEPPTPPLPHGRG